MWKGSDSTGRTCRGVSHTPQRVPGHRTIIRPCRGVWRAYSIRPYEVPVGGNLPFPWEIARPYAIVISLLYAPIWGVTINN